MYMTTTSFVLVLVLVLSGAGGGKGWRQIVRGRRERFHVTYYFVINILRT